MKTRSPLSFQFWSISTALLISLSAIAEVTVAVAPSEVDPAKLPYGVADVLKLSRAQVSEQVIATYIQNSGTAYNLNPNEIVYLRDQGVSERVINIMLEQRKRMIESLPQTPSAPAQQPTPAYANTAPAAPESYAQQAYAPASTVHVIPYPAASYAYYNSYPHYYPYYSSGYYYPYYSSYCRPYYGGYYGGYYGYRPGLSLSFAFGGYGHGGHGHHGSYGHGGHGSYGHGGHGSSGHHGGGIHAVSGGGHSGRHR
jgi:hypothetical protein